MRYAYIISQSGQKMVVAMDDVDALVMAMSVCEVCYSGDNLYEALRKGVLNGETDIG